MTETAIKYTEQQIEEYIRSLVAITRVYPQIEPALTASAEIIKQLQEEIKHPEFGTTGT